MNPASRPTDQGGTSDRSATRRICVQTRHSSHEHLDQYRSLRTEPGKGRSKPLQVMKFGGTSVGDAAAIRKVVEIILSAVKDTSVVVVVSAMAGVTNKLIEAAGCAESGDEQNLSRILEDVTRQHILAASTLIGSAERVETLAQTMRAILRDGERLCKDALLLREMSLPARDCLSGLGERLSAPLVAAALAENGVKSESIESTDLIVTDSQYGNAEPLMDITRERSHMRLHPLLRDGIVPVVTGFIGATVDGAVTTLGRGGSDYSATILGAALDADAVVIWTDVDGVLTADPRLVPDASPIPEMSYGEATELAHCGAKVLHPKTLIPVQHSQTPVWIRNTFAPECRGTKITPSGIPSERVRAVSVVRDLSSITVKVGEEAVNTLSGAVTGRAFVFPELLACPSPRFDNGSGNSVRFVVPSSVANQKAQAIRSDLSEHLVTGREEVVEVDLGVAIIALVGTGIGTDSKVVARALGALQRQNVDAIAVGRGPSEFSRLFVVRCHHAEKALNAVHQEFQLYVFSPEITLEDRNLATL